MSDEILNPTFEEMLSIYPQMDFTDVHYAACYLFSLPFDLMNAQLSREAAYGVAIYNGLKETLGIFTGQAVIPHIYRKVADRIASRQPLYCQNTPWRVLLADGQHVLIDGCSDIYQLPTMTIVKDIKPPLFTVSLDLMVVWHQLRANLARRQNGNYSRQAAV